MAKFTAKVVEFVPSFVFTSKAGKRSEQWKFEYEVGGNAKSFQGFASQLKTDRVLAKQLSQFSPGDYVEIETEKNAAGYDQIKSVQLAGSKQETAGAHSSSTGKVPAASRDFETKEERTARQRLIVRQSSLAQAVMISGPGTSKVDSMLKLAERLTDWVFEEESEPAFDAGKKEPDLKDDDLDDDVPL